jgi:hypothetical protein
MKTEVVDRKGGYILIIMEETKKKGNLGVLVKDQVINKISEDHEIKVYLNKKQM